MTIKRRENPAFHIMVLILSKTGKHGNPIVLRTIFTESMIQFFFQQRNNFILFRQQILIQFYLFFIDIII